MHVATIRAIARLRMLGAIFDSFGWQKTRPVCVVLFCDESSCEIQQATQMRKLNQEIIAHTKEDELWFFWKQNNIRPNSGGERGDDKNPRISETTIEIKIKLS